MHGHETHISDGADASRRRIPKGLPVIVALAALLVAACTPWAPPAQSDAGKWHRNPPAPAPAPEPAPDPGPPPEQVPDPDAPPAVPGDTFVVATNGSDHNPGSEQAPFRTIEKGLRTAGPGDLLLLRGGTYQERIQSPTLQAGTASQPVHVYAYPGERPVVQGVLWLKRPHHWHFNGINVTWSSQNSASDHMVKFTDGVGWSFRDGEVWGARSYAAILVYGTGSADWTIAENYVHDTHPANGTNQDHLIYANSGTGGGVIERNVLARSANGRAVKLGPSSYGAGVVQNVVVRYNTMVENTGPSNVQFNWGASNNQVYGNIMDRPAANRSAVTQYELTGSNNVVAENLGGHTPRIADPHGGIVDGGGNVLADPQLDGDFTPLNPAAQGFGHLA